MPGKNSKTAKLAALPWRRAPFACLLWLIGLALSRDGDAESEFGIRIMERAQKTIEQARHG